MKLKFYIFWQSKYRKMINIYFLHIKSFSYYCKMKFYPKCSLFSEHAGQILSTFKVKSVFKLMFRCNFDRVNR